ncbi:MAG: hypothetical protein ACFUZC_01500 [Chthoniobacteraceae bacterium]
MRFLIPLLALCLIAGAKKPKVAVRFHIEVNEVSGAPFIMTSAVPGSDRKVTLSKTAEINEDDIVAIYPFPVDDGTFGCAFRLDTHGRIALDSLSNDARGAMLVGFVNARAVTAMLVDKRVSDGVITMNRGLTQEEAILLTQAFPVLGQGGKKKPKKGVYIPAATPSKAAASSGLPQGGD